MTPYENNYKEIQRIITQFFADNPTGILPGVLLAFKVAEKPDAEPTEAMITYMPEGPKDEVWPQVEKYVSIMRKREDIAYVFRVHEAWGLVLTRQDVKNRPLMDVARERANERKSIIVVELYTADKVLVGVSEIDESTERKFVPKWTALEEPLSRWSPHDMDSQPNATRH